VQVGRTVIGAKPTHTIWSRGLASQLGGFLRTESGSSGVLVAAIVAALVWANASPLSYDTFWSTPLSLRLGDIGVSMDLREWVGNGLMTLFFLVVGLEARREFDLGPLRDRTQFAMPVLAGLAGMAIPVGIYLLVNQHSGGAHGWGVAMSTDTALALGLLTLVSRGLPERVKGFLLTLFIVDDLVALVVIAVAYSHHFQLVPLLVAVAGFALMLVCRRFRAGRVLSILFAFVTWGGLLFSGVDPVVAGLAIGLATAAYSPGREDLEIATGRFRQFREQPTSRLARDATASLRATLSPNERLQGLYHPWTSYAIVPLFALANAGIRLDANFLAAAYTAPITLGVIAAYVIGKPVAIIATSWLTARISRGRFRAPVGWAAVAGTGTIAGVGFTVSVLVATLAFTGKELDEAKLGVLTAAIAASIITWIVYRVTALLSPARRARALLGDGDDLVDLFEPVDVGRDHIRGPVDAMVTLVEYGDFQCPYCGRAEPAVRTLTEDVDIRFVWRHLPLTEVHPNAQLAAEAAEAAAAQGAFWAMHDLLLDRQEHLEVSDLVEYAKELNLDLERFQADLDGGKFRPRIDEDVSTADLSSVSGTPSFFINGQRHYGAYDVETLRAAVLAAHAKVGRSS
jgi:Na+/H+ antiporter NhaA